MFVFLYFCSPSIMVLALVCALASIHSPSLSPSPSLSFAPYPSIYLSQAIVVRYTDDREELSNSVSVPSWLCFHESLSKLISSSLPCIHVCVASCAVHVLPCVVCVCMCVCMYVCVYMLFIYNVHAFVTRAAQPIVFTSHTYVQPSKISTSWSLCKLEHMSMSSPPSMWHIHVIPYVYNLSL